MLSPVPQPDRATPLPAVLAVTFLCSLGTGVFWHGVPFIAKHTYDFSQARNLLLSSAMGAVYTLGAFTAGRVARRVEHRLSTRDVLGGSIGVLALVSLMPVLVSGEWALWFTGLAGTYVTSLVWPIIESYVTAGRHGPRMRSAIGWFNLTWAPAVTVPLFGMAPILEHHGQWAIGAIAVVGAIALVVLRWFARRPGHHDPDVASAHVGPEYPLLLRSARVLLPLSYVLNAAMNPLLPYRFEDLGVEVWWETPAAATWTVVRAGAFLLMWRLAFWHGRWGTLLLGAAAMTGGFAIIVTGPSLALVLVGLAALGFGLGVIYDSTLYYVMAVGRAEVGAGGVFEGLIGAGYTVGPVGGLIGSRLAGGLGIVAVVWGLVGLAAVPAVRPYLAARRGRAARAISREP